ncbi:DNA repair protein RAD51 homolog 2-like isoform X1 [Stegodyphus dumicola]|uniref:DNA repair protein RAD51 homolog 2-like isoform X1 n=1 Tax=Stegodyphus dumicola TaxID=202533 RepID=UPI0015A8EA8C|nr:DNA repair protein RAD51 homolog 2-like isoform X1 [Stegodyphus dumicola]
MLLKCLKDKIYYHDVLALTPLEFQTLLGIDRRKAEKLLDKISKKCVSHPETVFQLCSNQNKASNEFFSLSLNSLDLLLQGGLPFGSISEITGPPGVGKTQFCFMLSMIATLPVSLGGADGEVLYIDTESTFSAERIVAMARKRFPQIFKQNKEIELFLQKISVHKATSVSALKDIVSNIEKDVIQKNVKLIIVDSIASLLRKEYGAASIESIMERNNILLEQAAILKDLAQTYKIVVSYMANFNLIPVCF